MHLEALNDSQRVALKKGRFHKLEDIVLTSTELISRRCKITPLEAERIVQLVCGDDLPEIKTLDAYDFERDIFTSGDEHLDRALGGGVRTGMIWEVVGESGAGKTQLALHLSLTVQLPQESGGLSGSTCYLTTSSKLPTARLLEIRNGHPNLARSSCGLEDIHTMPSPNIPFLIEVLAKTLPAFIGQLSSTRPVKLVVIDALGELFHTTDKTTTQTLIERSRDITQISLLLHTIASKYNIAVVVLNEVVDTFDRGYIESDEAHLSYSEQARWFGRASTVPGEDKKEASLGLVWANQVNVRIQLSRTGRRRHVDDNYLGKRRKLQMTRVDPPKDDDDSDRTTLIRRLSVIFSSVSLPASMDYIVSPAGLFGLPDDTSSIPPPRAMHKPALTQMECPLSTQIPPLDQGEFADDVDEEPPNEWDVPEALSPVNI